MSTRIIPIHPATGRNPPAGGAKSIQHNGSFTSFGYQRFSESLDSLSHFHGVILPEDILTTGTIAIRGTFRQFLSAANVEAVFDCGVRDIAKGDDRDSILPLVSITGALLKTLPGVAGDEFTLSWEYSSDTLAGGRELLFWIRRLGATDIRDNFNDEVGLVGLEVQIPIPEEVINVETMDLEKEENCLLEQILDRLSQIETITDYWSK